LVSWHFSGKHSDAGDQRLAFVEREPLGFILQPQ
jgi:hypothetical protein